MSNIIRIKRRSALGAAGSPSSLYNAELAYNEKDNVLYYGFGDNGQGIATSIIPIAGTGALDSFLVEGKNIDITYDAGVGTHTIDLENIVDDLYELGVDNLNLNGNTISSVIGISTDPTLLVDTNIYIDPTDTGYVQIVGTNGLVIPVGNATTQQAPNIDGTIRLNNVSWQFEGYSNGNWASLGGVRSVDGFTYISAELTPNNSDDTLRFYTGNIAGTGSDLPVTITSSTLEVNSTTLAVNPDSTPAGLSGALVVNGGAAIGGNLIVLGGFNAIGEVSYADGVTFEDFITLNGPVYSDLDTFELLNTDATGVAGTGPTTVNALLSATTINLGASTGTTTVNNDLQVGSQTSSSAVDIYGNVVIQSGSGTSSLTVDNVVIDGNTISSNDISNVLIIDPAPVEGETSAIEISAIGTVGSITGTGPWNAVITGMTSTTGLVVGSAITATNSTGSLGAGGTYVVDQVLSNSSVSIVATGGTTPVAGTISSIKEINEQGLVIIKGNLQVDGLTTTVNSTTVTIDDPVFTLGGEGAPVVSDQYDRGIEFNWMDDTSTPALGFFGWDRSTQEFVFIDHATTPTANSFVPDTGNTYSDIRIGSATLVDSTDAIQLNAGLYSSSNTGTIVVTGGVNIGLSLYVENHIVGEPPAAGVYSSKIENFLIDGGIF